MLVINYHYSLFQLRSGCQIKGCNAFNTYLIIMGVLTLAILVPGLLLEIIGPKVHKHFVKGMFPKPSSKHSSGRGHTEQTLPGIAKQYKISLKISPLKG